MTSWRITRDTLGPIKVSQRWLKNDQGKKMTVVRKAKSGWWVIRYDVTGVSHTTNEKDIYKFYTRIR